MEEENGVDIDLSSGDVHQTSELRIVLLGNKAAGKSSSGNTILGKQEFTVKTAQCVKRCGDVEGRKVTVVEAPGWWRNYLIKDTPALHEEEIILSTSLCPPGPHAVLIVVRLDSDFTITHRRAIEERVQLLGMHVWNHSILLFTHGDSLQDTSFKKYIKNKGQALESLIANCMKRWHVFDNEIRKDNKQVTELLQKIDNMVAENKGHHFAMDHTVLHNIQVKREAEEKRAKERIMAVEKQRQLFHTGQIQSQLRIVLVGHRYSGRSSAGNTILGRQEFDLRRSLQGVMRQGEVFGRQVTVVEAPGWWNTYLLEDSPELYKPEFVSSVCLCPPGPQVLLLVIRVDGSFTPKNRTAIKQHLELLTQKVWKHTLVLFTYGDWLGDTAIEQHIESEGEALKCLIEDCGNRYHVLNNNDGSNVNQVTELLEKIEEMVCRNGGLHDELDQEFLQQIEEKKRQTQERAKQRMMRGKNKTETEVWIGDTHFHPKLRIVLLGPRCSGKSSTANTILGHEERVDIAGVQGVTRIAARRLLTVIESSALQKMDVNSYSESPYALLLVIQADTSFTETTKSEYMRLVNHSVWKRTLVLFTCGDWLGDTSIEQHIESEGEALQKLLEACGNRYHVFNNMIQGDETQVLELMEKIEEMLSEEGGHFFTKSLDVIKVVSKPCSYKERRLSDAHIRDNQSIHHPPTMDAHDRSLIYSQDSLSGSSQSGSMASSLSSGIGSLSQNFLQESEKGHMWCIITNKQKGTCG